MYKFVLLFPLKSREFLKMLDHDLEQISILCEKDNFMKCCEICEDSITLPNLVCNGGTLNFSGLVYDSDILMLAYDGDSIVGFNSLVFYRNSIYVYQIAVMPDYKQKGIGSSMLNVTKTLADQLVLPITANVRDYNIASQKSFEKCGFRKDLENSLDNDYFYYFIPEKKRQKGNK